MIDWATVNMAAFVAAIFILARVPALASAQRVADVLMINWAIGAALWAGGKAVPLPMWIDSCKMPRKTYT